MEKEKIQEIDFYKLGNKYGFSEHGTSPNEIYALKIAMVLTLLVVILLIFIS